MLVSVGGWFIHREKLAALAAEHLRLVVTGPSTIQAGIGTEYLVSTTAINGQPLPAKVEAELLTLDGKRLKAFNQTADERGRLQVAIPSDLKLPPLAQFRVVAWHGDARTEPAETTLLVERPRYDAQLRSGSTALSAGRHGPLPLVVLSRFGLAADRDVPVQFRSAIPAGAVVAWFAACFHKPSAAWADGEFPLSR